MYLRRKFKVYKKLGTQNANSQIAEKRIGPQITNPQIATFSEGPLIKFADLRFAELICGPPNFDAMVSPSYFLLNEYLPIDIQTQSTYICTVEYIAVSRVYQNIDPPTPFPPSECVLPPHQRRGVHNRRAVRGMGGQYFGRRET
jgi:hypothetical protein